MTTTQVLFLFVEAALAVLLIALGGLPARAAAALYLAVGSGLVGIASVVAAVWDIDIFSTLVFREVQISTAVPLGLGYVLIAVGLIGLAWTELRRPKAKG